MTGVITRDDFREMMAQAAANVEDDEPIEVRTRTLDEDEVLDLFKWLVLLPGASWSPEDAQKGLNDLLESRQALITIPVEHKGLAIYAKLTWG